MNNRTETLWPVCSSHQSALHKHTVTWTGSGDIQVPLSLSKGIFSFKNENCLLFFLVFWISTWMNVCMMCYFSRSRRVMHVIDSLIKASLETVPLSRVLLGSLFQESWRTGDLWTEKVHDQSVHIGVFKLPWLYNVQLMYSHSNRFWSGLKSFWKFVGITLIA